MTEGVNYVGRSVFTSGLQANVVYQSPGSASTGYKGNTVLGDVGAGVQALPITRPVCRCTDQG